MSQKPLPPEARKPIIINIFHGAFPYDCEKQISHLYGGWGTYLLKTLSTRFITLAFQPTHCRRPIYERIGNAHLLKFPVDVGSILGKLAKFIKFDIHFEDLAIKHYLQAQEICSSHEPSVIIYMHEFRRHAGAYVARPLLKRCPIIFQRHAYTPPRNLYSSSWLRRAYWYIVDGRLAKFEKAVLFTLDATEIEYLRSLGVRMPMFVRPMAADFNEIKPDERAKEILPKYGINADVVLMTYIGNPRQRGARYLPKLKERLGNRVAIVATSAPPEWIEPLRRRGIHALGRIPQGEYYQLLKASDLYFLAVTSAFKYQNVLVAVMEAWAAGKPVVSPTLVYFPELDKVYELGAPTPFVDSPRDFLKFVDALEWVLGNLGSYNPFRIRELTSKYYSWESFLHDFENAVKLLIG